MLPDRLPVIGIPACLRTVNERVFHSVSEKYLAAVIAATRCVPILIPAIGGRRDVAGLLDALDGLLLTGSPSNVEPEHYGGPTYDGTLHDPERDATTLPLIREAVRRDLPILAICRGIQELNVALGGSLHQRVHELPGRLNHRAPPGETTDDRYRPIHSVSLAAGGLLAALAGASEVMVNSLHSQGIDRPAAGLFIEAVAADGQIEAVRLPQARFVIGVQWHPEHRVLEIPFSRALFAAFGEACAGGRSDLSAANRAA
jgi:putative glutamine amidotransferase